MQRFLVSLVLTVLIGTGPGQAQQDRTIQLDVVGRAVTGSAVEVAGGLGVVRVTQGDQVELRWTTDEETEVHLHGYDIEVELMPGTEQVMTFEARATGRFAIEAHGFGQDHGDATLMYLEVLPR